MEAIKHRVLTLGGLENSDGGAYNPGVIAIDNTRILLPRVEKDYSFKNEVVEAVLVTGNIDYLKEGKYDEATVLRKIGFPKSSRIEDFRLFKFKDELYCTCTWVWGWNGMANSRPKLITPIICKISIEHSTITLFDYLELPLKQKQTEKNWSVFVHNDELYCLYSLDPFILFRHKGFSWKLVKEEENGLINILQNRLPGAGYLSLSAMTQWDERLMLGFWHTYVKGVIYQGAFILNMETFDITEFTPPLLDGKEFTDGYKKYICYVSGLVVNESNVEVWFGECDSHTSMLELDKKELTDILVASPFIKQTPLKVGFSDAGMGDFICMTYALQGYLDKHPERTVKLYMRNHFELASAIKMPRVQIHTWEDQDVVVDLTSNDEPEYGQKLQLGDAKKWYSMKLNSTPTCPDVSHITPNERYRDCIVLAPFSAWSNRDWPTKYWVLLSEILMQQGHHLIVMDIHENRCRNIHGEKIIGRSIWECYTIIKSAKLLIGNDSGLAHAAGLLGTPLLVLSGWLNPETYYSNTDVNFIWENEDRDHQINLKKITVERVVAKLKEMGI